MIEFVRINGTAVRVTNLARRMAGGADGPPRREVTLVIIARDEQTHQAVLDLVAPGDLTLEIPEDNGPETFPVEVVSAGHVAMGSGETTAYRHEITLRERDPTATGPSRPDPAADVALRLEALIQALEADGVIDRTAVEETYRRLLEDNRPFQTKKE